MESGYGQQLTEQLMQGFLQGFDIGYRGPSKRKNYSHNLPLRVRSKLELWNKVMKEVKANRYSGPYHAPPCQYFVQSPLGLVPKTNDKTQLIFHLSYDFGGEDKSVNFYTPDHLCTVQYKDLDYVIRECLRLLQQSGITEGTIYYSKTDCSNAFRVVPVLIK